MIHLGKQADWGLTFSSLPLVQRMLTMTSICFSEIMLRTSGLSVNRHWITPNTSVRRGKRKVGGEEEKERTGREKGEGIVECYF